MLFSSLIFLWVFLVITLGGYYLFNLIKFKDESKRIKAKNIFLLVMSLIFYAWGGIYYLLILISSILLNFFGTLLIKKKISDKYKKLSFIILLILNLAILFFFKYFNMLGICIEAILELPNGINTSFNVLLTMESTGKLGLKEIVLPIGISFFTFQALSYSIDAYLNKVELQENVFDFALYVSLFPQLIAGPIVKYSDVCEQLHNRKETLDGFFYGMKRFIYGLSKKTIIANNLALVADQIWALEFDKMGYAIAWLGLICYTLQIYFDFSGYSDMAIGLGKMFGFDFKENFDYPYTSLSIQEFWRRWHISLSSWFKEYVYIPLGGSRKGLARTCLNLFIVFLLTGIWHGANFTFLLWGVYFAFFLIIERLFLSKLLEKNPFKFINWIYMIFVVMIGWVFFRSDNIVDALNFVKALFSKSDGTYSLLTYVNMKTISFIVIGIIVSGPIQRYFKNKFAGKNLLDKTPVIILDYTFQMILLIICILLMVSGSYNPFIYFQF